MFKRTNFIFSILVAYIVLQFLWWEILLVKQSGAIISLKQNIAALSSSDDTIILREIALLQEKKITQVYMIVGEGTVFLLILLFGVFHVRKSIRKEKELATQKSNFILSVSHELKTPIAATKLQLQTLLKHELERDKQKELLHMALNETSRLHKLVDNVLMANQIENKNLSVQKENINLSALVEDTVKRYFAEQLENKMITINIEKDIYYSGDKELLPSIFINLIENAIKYSFDKVHIEVMLKMLHNKPLLEIKDQGCGIPDEEKETIFHKFYRSGNEHTRKTKGTGIGLYIVKSICDLHNVHIKALNHSPNGSIFQLQF
ncbi:MAG: HAMP domain-containing histidine kinase [Burkholderiales bacterium]|nr:HAMP domain-containing histidine kinase [Bacteroidia bacterium]